MDEKHVYAVDEDGECFAFSTSECKFEAVDGRRESNVENRHDWLIGIGVGALICRGIGGKILWRMPDDLEWKEVKGLEELQQQHPGLEIIKLCPYSVERLAIFWEARPQGILELWFAELTLVGRMDGEVWEVNGNIEWSGPVLSDSSYTGLNLLCAGSLYL
ncbi:unnamed protein product [Microthlaspi erraticum]|uniref:F-box associated domain-containing protein n=1 Tax=Microthlaspi erraticum TaxID=1685480 RepID=A0A6D2KRR3_9BRAS|nr:unnamed protein product [Microthlaspi erraticum]